MLRVSRRLFRGPQPGLTDLERLQAKGLKAVFNLREESQESRALCAQLGLAYHFLPVRDWSVPGLDQVEEFLQMLQEPDYHPALVHCMGGIGRTGIFVSCYRIRRGMDWQQALRMSDDETPWMQMSAPQRAWVRSFAQDQESL